MKRTTFTILFSFLVTIAAYSCGPFDRNYLAKDYYTFRVCGDNIKGKYTSEHLNSKRMKLNCEAWADITSSDIPLADIEEVVYKWNISQVKALTPSFLSFLRCQPDNKFARWIIKNKDREIIKFLVLAKTCEKIRTINQTKWYYPVDDDQFHIQLNQIIKQSQAYSGSRLADRYCLQAIRAYFSLGEYSQCITYWNDHAKSLMTGVLREMAVDYVTGCHIHLNESDQAVQLYLDERNTYAASLIQVPQSERFAWIYQHNPDDDWLLEDIQHRIHKYESENTWSYSREPSPELSKLTHLVRTICSEKRCQDMAPWYYTYAFLRNMTGHTSEALNYIEKAKRISHNQDLSAAIRVFELMLNIKQESRYTKQFESKLGSELKWLDSLIKTNLTPAVRETIATNGIGNHICGFSQYYWNDMWRKILISQVAPLCLKSGYPTRALTYLNMADNHIFCLVDSVDNYFWDSHLQESTQRTFSWSDYRLSENVTNAYDYSNDFFIVLDSIGVNHLQKYAEELQHPQTPLDSFMVRCSYSDSQYLHEIIGTQLIASMRYAEAIPYLQQVSEPFNRSRNIFGFCNVDPFTGSEFKDKDPHYKLHFAERMHQLELAIDSCTNPNDRADLYIEYARGFYSSVGPKCWPLTSYYYGCFYCYPFHSNYQQQLHQKILSTYYALCNKALNLYTDDERAAQSYYDLCLFKTAVEKYPNTAVAEFIRGHCDELKDY